MRKILENFIKIYNRNLLNLKIFLNDSNFELQRDYPQRGSLSSDDYGNKTFWVLKSFMKIPRLEPGASQLGDRTSLVPQA